MSTLTKVFIVLQLVFALVTSVMLILFVSATPKYKDQVVSANQRWTAAELALLSTSQELTLTKNTNAELTKDVSKNASAWKSQSDAQQTRIAELTKKNDEMQVALTNLETNLHGLTAAVESKDNQNRAYADELKKVRPDIQTYIQRYAEVARQNNELTQQLNSANRAIRRLQEELAAQAEAFATKPAAAASAAPGSQVTTLGTGIQTPSQVNAKIARVQNNNGRMFITMALGKRDGVRENTQFIISRNGQYIGDAVVREVTVNECVAVVTVTKQGATVQAGDMVMSGQNP